MILWIGVFAGFIVLENALIHLFKVGDRIIKCHEIQRSISLNILRILDGVAQIGKGECGGRECVHGGVAHVRTHKLEQRNFIQRELISGIEVLAVISSSATFANTVPQRVFLNASVYTSVRFVNTCGGIGFELQFQALENIPVDAVVSCPVKRFHIVGINNDIPLALRTILELLQISVQRGAEGHILWHGGHVEIPNQLQPFALSPFCTGEGPVIFRICAERVSDFPMMDELIVHFHILIALNQF